MWQWRASDFHEGLAVFRFPNLFHVLNDFLVASHHLIETLQTNNTPYRKLQSIDQSTNYEHLLRRCSVSRRIKKHCVHCVAKTSHLRLAITSTHVNRFWYFSAHVLLRQWAIKSCFIFLPQHSQLPQVGHFWDTVYRTIKRIKISQLYKTWNRNSSWQM